MAGEEVNSQANLVVMSPGWCHQRRDFGKGRGNQYGSKAHRQCGISRGDDEAVTLENGRFTQGQER